MEAVLQDTPSAESVPLEIPFSSNGRKFTLKRMDGEQTAEWLSLRLAAWWRQIYVFRKIRNNVFLGASSAGKHSTDDSESTPEAIMSSIDKKGTDDKLFELSSEWLTVNNHLVARALGIYTATDSPFVRLLCEHEKLLILAAQDKLNGLDMISIFEKNEREKNVKNSASADKIAIVNDIEKKLQKKLKEFKKKKK
jgi:hypothetical protein